MTLEDFFTLSEMKDGLATLNRVEELLSLMQNQEKVTGGVGDMARHWTTVANILAVTANRDCLYHFVQLNGVSFLNNWLYESPKGTDNSSDYSTEELITALLKALDRLPFDREKFSASGTGIVAAVKQCHGHASHAIQDKAKCLSDKWKLMEDTMSKCQSDDPNDPFCKDGTSHSTELTRIEALQSINVDIGISPSGEVSNSNADVYSNSSVNTAEDAKISSNQISSISTLNSLEKIEASGEVKTTSSNLCGEQSLLMKESLCQATEVASTSICSSPASEGTNVEEPSDLSNKQGASDSPEAMDIEVNMKEVGPYKNSDDLCAISVHATFHKNDNTETCIESKCASDPNLKVDKCKNNKASGVLKSPVDTCRVGEKERSISEIGLEYGEIDALEVARQVAIEVEREVVDYREPFCSSSPEVISRVEILDSCSSDLEENRSDKLTGQHVSENRSPRKSDLSDSSSPRNIKIPLGDGDNEVPVGNPESSKSTLAPGSIDMENNKCIFDLNEDVCSETTDFTTVQTANQASNLSVPIHVAASKGAPSVPVTSLNFEGELGWRGSAATSAFRPASPRRLSDSDKSICGPKKNTNFLQIDLNMVEGEDDGASDHLVKKHDFRYSYIPSDKCTMERSSGRADKFKLDLNRTEDEDTVLNQPSHWRPNYQTMNCSSSASSSSSRQHPIKDFDLNDNPCMFDPYGANNTGKTSPKDAAAHGNYKVDDPVITIMGSRMCTERKEPVNQLQCSFLGNGLSVDLAPKAIAPYPSMPSHAYGYNGLQMGTALSISPPFYGPGSIPYMVNSRGSPVIPPMLGSPCVSGVTTTRPHFLMTIPGAPQGLNVVGLSRPCLDLNSGSTTDESGFRQLFLQGNSGLMEDRLPSASQPAGSGVMLKRKEPDCGWEPYNHGYKHATWQ